MKARLSRAMVLRQPWAQAVVEGSFPVLIRSRRTNIRGFVGVLSTTKMDPKVRVKAHASYAMKSLVGAVSIRDCLTLEGDVDSFLAEAFGREFADFYPDHFIPDERPRHLWVLGRAIEPGTPLEWDGDMSPTWVTLDGEVEVQGEGRLLLSDEDLEALRQGRSDEEGSEAPTQEPAG